jgi:zinc D-Ala-D-Ala carboxypeptidase
VKLSTNFDLQEFTFSPTAVRKCIDNTPNEAVIANLQTLCIHVLQPLRDKLGKEIRITSGYRSKELNKAIGGARNSQHVEGKAADIQVFNTSSEDLFQFIKRNIPEYDQLIQEFDEWVHISWNGFNNRNQCLRAIKENGKTKYIPV